MFDYANEIERLGSCRPSSGSGPALREAGEQDLAQFRQLGVPEAVIDFYVLAEPARIFEYKGIWLLPISEILKSNANAVPGVASSRYGLVVVASTVSGDAYCIDINTTDEQGLPPVYIICHEKVHEDASEVEVWAGSSLFCKTFLEFLRRFVAGKLPYDYYQALTYDPNEIEPPESGESSSTDHW
jgi:hypothetical protein